MPFVFVVRVTGRMFWCLFEAAGTVLYVRGRFWGLQRGQGKVWLLFIGGCVGRMFEGACFFWQMVRPWGSWEGEGLDIPMYRITPFRLSSRSTESSIRNSVLMDACFGTDGDFCGDFLGDRLLLGAEPACLGDGFEGGWPVGAPACPAWFWWCFVFFPFFFFRKPPAARAKRFILSKETLKNAKPSNKIYSTTEII